MPPSETAWGRAPHAGRWPRPTYAAMGTVIISALVAAVLVGEWRYDHLTPSQQFYLPQYLKSALALRTGLPLPAVYREWAGTDHPLAHAEAYAWFRTRVFHQSLRDFVRPSLLTALAALPLLPLAWRYDRRRLWVNRQGSRLRGPVIGTLHGDGIGWVQGTGAVSRLMGPSWVRIPRAKEASHLLIMGDTDTGKSVLVRHSLLQIQARGELAIVHDPHLEFTKQFYNEARGDIILNPLDLRSPYWSPGDEFDNPAEALAIATSLFPDDPHEPRYWMKNTRKLFAFLLETRPSPQELSYWLSHEEEIDRRVEGTALATMLNRDAASMRYGFLSTLSEVAEPLALLPFERETTSRWSANAWSKQPRGWIFLTSTSTTQDRLLPLQSLWIDLLVLRMMNRPDTSQKIWFILDELPVLQNLPQLQKAITTIRKSNAPILLVVQGRAQLEEKYGPLAAETMLAMTYTKIVLKTGEPKAAKWCSDMLGTMEEQRQHESRSTGPHAHRSIEQHRAMVPLVMDAQITGLPDMTAFLKCGNTVVPMQWPYLTLPHVAVGLIPREVRPMPTPVPPEVARPPHAVPVRAHGKVR